MSGPSLLLGLAQAARRRVQFDTLAVGLPLTAALAVAAGRLAGPWIGALVALVGLAVTGAAALARSRRIDQTWLTARLNAGLDRFEDSAALLFQPTDALAGLAVLQRRRLEARIAEARSLDLRPPWSRRTLAGAWGASTVIVLAAVLTPSAPPGADQRAASTTRQPVGPPRVTRTRLRIIPPAYTGLPTREQTALDARVPEGSRLEWTFEMNPAPESAALAFPDDDAAALSRDGRRWSATRRIERSTLYRLEVAGLPRQRLHRIDAVADAPPTVRLVTPTTQLVMATPGQRRWTAVFEADDDHGVEASATLRITVTQGEGEQVAFEQRSRIVRGVGERRRKRYSVAFDLAREGLTPGGDLIVQLVVSDNRASGRQVVEGPSVILRSPSQQLLADGLEGMLRPTMPAYFRSQRQIIIDAEALIAQRRRIDDAQFITRSNALGIDQAQLRLRYGQFMGEESEGGGLDLPTNDAPAGPPLPTSDAPASTPPQAEHHDGDGHDHEGAAPSMGDAVPVDAAREFGHVHDDGDAATLFDPETRTRLSAVLDAMWGSERALRLGLPEDALPYAHRALELLKELQQADRIYLNRVGSNLPPIDPTRRLTGKRADIVAEAVPPPRRPPVDTAALDTWRALEGGTGSLGLDALDRWVRANTGRLRDPLALTAAIDTVRNDPACLPCRARLRGQLWNALERPAAAVRRRETVGERGRRYLDALQ